MTCIQTGDLILKLGKERSSSDDVILKENSLYQMLTLTTFSNITNTDFPNMSQLNQIDLITVDQRDANCGSIQPSIYNQELSKELSKTNFEDCKVDGSTEIRDKTRMLNDQILSLERENKIYKINQIELVNRYILISFSYTF
jgi:hypothetical protein